MGTEHQTVFVISTLMTSLAHTSTDALKQTSHVHHRSHEGASHCRTQTSEFDTFKITGIAAPIKELIIEHKHEKKMGTEHQTVFVISALMM